MPNPFIEQRLEIPFNYGATYGPRFKTDIGTQSDGTEQRSPKWIDPLIFIDLAQYSVNADEIDYLLSFHESVKGSGIGFRIKDWSDYLAPAYTLGTGNGTEQAWQLVKTYTIGAYSVKRVILKPVDGSVVLRVDGEIAESGWSIDTTTGVITTNLTGVLSVDEFEFDIPVRFEQDKINFAFDAADNWGNKFFKMQALICVELRIKPQVYPALDPIPDALPQIILGYDYGTTGGPQFETSIVQAGSEFEDRKSFWDNPLGGWNIGDRGLSRAETDYLIAFFRACRGRLVPFGFYDWQDQTTKRVRFSEDTIRLRFDAYRDGDRQVKFNLGGIGVKEVRQVIEGFYYAGISIDRYRVEGGVEVFDRVTTFDFRLYAEGVVEEERPILLGKEFPLQLEFIQLPLVVTSSSGSFDWARWWLVYNSNEPISVDDSLAFYVWPGPSQSISWTPGIDRGRNPRVSNLYFYPSTSPTPPSVVEFTQETATRL